MDEVRWGDPPFEVVGRATKPAGIRFTAGGSCRVVQTVVQQSETERTARVSATETGTCAVVAVATSSTAGQARDDMQVVVGRARPVITFDDASVPAARPFFYSLKAGVQPELPLTYASTTPGCTVEQSTMTLRTAWANAEALSAASASTLPVTCVVEARVAASESAEAAARTATVTVTAPVYRLIATPARTTVQSPFVDPVEPAPPPVSVRVVLTERSGLAVGVTGRSDDSRCTVGEVSGARGATEFTTTIAVAASTTSYVCRIDWSVEPLPGATSAGAETVIVVAAPSQPEPPNVP